MICVVLADLTFPEVKTLLKQEEMAEIRLDLLNLNRDQIAAIFQSHPRLVATCRKGRHSDQERQALLALALQSGAAYIDIENDAPQDFRQSLTKLARSHGAQAIISYHNFEMTPSFAELQLIHRDCESLSAAIVKIVTYCHSPEDAERLLALYSINTKPLIAFGMGDAGKNSRTVALRRGAPFIYAAAYSSKVTAPGQLTKAEILALLAREKPYVN
jgi:3-dehydroquinate dehydratase type I